MSEVLSFEKAFERLEQILEKMNSGKAPLEESLKLFEEAEKLIGNCSSKLTEAEQKIEQLVKNKADVVLNATGAPLSEPFKAGR